MLENLKGPLTEREKLSSLMFDGLKSDIYEIMTGLTKEYINITTVINRPAPSILFKLRHARHKNELDNPASYRLVFSKNGIFFEMSRETVDRKIAEFSYEDPELFTKLISTLACYSIRLML